MSRHDPDPVSDTIDGILGILSICRMDRLNSQDIFDLHAA
jgi:hypothetical protein